MFRIDGPGAVGELPPAREGVSEPGYFGPGNPATGQMSTRVTYEWLNAVQEELTAVIARAGIGPSKQDNAQLLAALRILFAAPEDIFLPDGVTIKAIQGKLTAIFPSRYDVGEFYYFRHPTLKPGFQPAQGGLLQNAAALYPDAWAYLQTAEGRKLCTTEAEWQAMTTAIWHTNADGTAVGWNGIGGAPWYVQDLNAGTLRLPDLRGMYIEAAGFDSLGVGGTHGDGIRNIYGSITQIRMPVADSSASGAFAFHAPSGTPMTALTASLGPAGINFNASALVPVANKNQPRAWGALACVYLGQPAS